MKRLLKGIEYEIKNIPELDLEFIPVEAFYRAYENQAKKRLVIAIIGNEDVTSTYETNIY